jgi:hypothetical protein
LLYNPTLTCQQSSAAFLLVRNNRAIPFNSSEKFGTMKIIKREKSYRMVPISVTRNNMKKRTMNVTINRTRCLSPSRVCMLALKRRPIKIECRKNLRNVFRNFSFLVQAGNNQEKTLWTSNFDTRLLICNTFWTLFSELGIVFGTSCRLWTMINLLKV